MRPANLTSLLLLALLAATAIPTTFANAITLESQYNGDHSVKSVEELGGPKSQPIIQADEEEDQEGKPEIPLPPVLIAANTTQVIERNDTINQGAVFIANPNETITVFYKVIGGNTSVEGSDTPLILHVNTEGDSDDAGAFDEIELSVVDNVDYEEETNSSIIIHGVNYTYVNEELAIWNYTIQVTSAYIEFYASWMDINEGFGSTVVNVITTGFYINSTINDTTYTQYEDVQGMVSFHQAQENDTIEYNVLTDEFGATTEQQNVTNEAGGNHTESIDLETYDVGIVIEIWASATFNDTMLNSTRSIIENAVHNTTIVQGNPSVSIDVPAYYVNNATLPVNASATVEKGEITEITVFVTNGSIHTANISETVVTDVPALTQNIALPRDENYTIVVLAKAGSGSEETNISVVLDRIVPTVQVQLDAQGDLTITGSVCEAQLEFSFDDERSGIQSVVLDFGDGSSKEVKDLDAYTHRYLTNGQYNIIITAKDKAGNIATDSFQITFKTTELETGEGEVWRWVSLVVLIVFVIAMFVLWSRRNK